MLLYLCFSSGAQLKSLSRNIPPTSFPVSDTWRGESLGSLVCRRLALKAFVMKSQALDVLFRLGTNQCRTPIHPPLVPLPGLLPFWKQMLKSEEKSSAFVLLQRKYLAPVAGERCLFYTV